MTKLWFIITERPLVERAIKHGEGMGLFSNAVQINSPDGMGFTLTYVKAAYNQQACDLFVRGFIDGAKQSKRQ